MSRAAPQWQKDSSKSIRSGVRHRIRKKQGIILVSIRAYTLGLNRLVLALKWLRQWNLLLLCNKLAVKWWRVTAIWSLIKTTWVPNCIRKIPDASPGTRAKHCSLPFYNSNLIGKLLKNRKQKNGLRRTLQLIEQHVTTTSQLIRRRSGKMLSH